MKARGLPPPPVRNGGILIVGVLSLVNSGVLVVGGCNLVIKRSVIPVVIPVLSGCNGIVLMPVIVVCVVNDFSNGISIGFVLVAVVRSILGCCNCNGDVAVAG